jgi:hypothetical protein
MRRRRGAIGGRRAYCARMEATLRDWDDLFDALAAEAAAETTHVRRHTAGCAAAFRPRRDDAERALVALRAPGADWPRAAADLDRAVRELERLGAQMATATSATRGFVASLDGSDRSRVT